MVSVRKLRKQEMEQWVKAIHKVCEPGWGVPSLRAAYAHLTPFVDDNCDTAYTDCQYRIGVGAKLLDPEQTSLEQLAIVILHETMHNTQHHRQRFFEKRNVNQKLGNFATDLEINSLIAEGVLGIDLDRAPSPTNGHWEHLLGEFKKLTEEEAEELNAVRNENGDPMFGKEFSSGDWNYQGCLLPRQGQFHDFPENKTAEAYLSLMEVEVEDTTLSQFLSSLSNDDSNGEQGNEDGSGLSSDSQEGSDGNTGTGNSQGTGDATAPQSSNGEYNDGFGGTAKDQGDGHVTVTHIYKKNADGTRTEVGRDNIVDDLGKFSDKELWDEVSSKLGINPITRVEEQKVRDQIAHDIELERKSNGYGAGAGGMILNYLEKGLRAPVINWQRVLRQTVTRACNEQTKGRSDYTYRHINRRYSQGDFIFPGMTDYTPKIRFALDTSGSMSQEEYFNALSEAEGVLKYIKAKIEFVCWDGDASEVSEVRTVKEMRNRLVGGGGTLASVPFKQAAEQKANQRPDIILCATDGCFDWKELAESLSDPALKNVIPIVLVVYRFSEDGYYAKQGEFKDRQNFLRKYHKKAIVLQAWSSKGKTH